MMGSTVALYAAYEHRALSSSDSKRQSGELVERRGHTHWYELTFFLARVPNKRTVTSM